MGDTGLQSWEETRNKTYYNRKQGQDLIISKLSMEQNFLESQKACGSDSGGSCD